MRNPDLVQSWDTVNPDPETQARLLGRIFTAAHHESASPAPRRPVWRILLPIAISVVLVAAIVVPLLNRPHDVALTASHGVTAVWLPRPPQVSVAYDLVPLTEQEMLTGVDIFAATVTKIQTIEVTFPDWTNYMSVLTVRVDSVVRGDLTPGTSTTILTHNLWEPNVWVEGSTVSSLLKVGGSALFLGTPAAGATAGTIDGPAVFYYSDVAQYFLGDGTRPLFVQLDSGVAFDTWGWPTLAAQGTSRGDGTSTVANMQVVEDFIHSVIGG